MSATAAAEPVRLDHVILLTENLDRAAELFARLGFTVTPRTEHSPAMGTANCCVMLAGTYIEILTVLRPTERSAGWRALLAQGDGLRGIALRIDDAEQTARALGAAGFPMDPPIAFDRLDDRGQRLSFKVCRLPAAETPGFRLILCQHETPELVWRPEWLDHANGARDIRAASLALPDPALARAVLGRVGAALPRAPARAEVAFTPASEPSRLTIAVADLDRAARALDAAGFTPYRHGPRLTLDLTATLDLMLTLDAGP
ncbi:VOC family protein [Chelatococcus sp. GCM10030263]|uniref:VOC family protein n=1 Tax=Chelatococcus sp. GCM10030263 TaxID=3273387 RepID=UPI00360A9369